MRTLTFTAFLALAGIVSADTVVLKNGGRLEGVTTSIEDGKLVVKLQSGTVKFNREDVLKVIHRVSPLEQYHEAAAKLKPGDAKGHFELAGWARDNDLKHFERVELEATIAADADHKEARALLGYENVGGKWLRGEELLKAKGLVKVDGKWLTKEAAQALAAEKEKRRLDKALAEAAAKAEREERMDDLDRLREFYESQRRVNERIYDRGRSFDRRRAPRAYPRGYDYDWSTPYDYSGYYSFGTYGYTPGYYVYGAPRYYSSYPSIGFRYSGRNYSISFGTNHYGYGYYPYGYGYRRYSGGSFAPSSYGPFGTYVPGSGGTSPGYYSSHGAFDRGGLAPGYGGHR